MTSAAIPAISRVPVRSAPALTRRWALLLSPPVFGARSLWLAWFGRDGRQSPVVIPVDDIPLRPDGAMWPGLLGLHETVAEAQLGGEGHLAMALCRPGRSRADGDDRAWADSLHELLDDRHGLTWSLHLAAGGRVEQLVAPADDAFPDSSDQP